MKFTITENAGVTTLVLEGKLDTVRAGIELHEIMTELLHNGYRKITIDTTRIQVIHVACAGEIIYSGRRAREANTELYLTTMYFIDGHVSTRTLRLDDVEDIEPYAKE